ncbi:multi-sensor signal transduction histidine kinase [Neolewinella xylanilytica]|uniref:histidine kinase n=1 Tax=Neolewinella xylanilytica TaxID=1514080 RepID=A0A2S6I939_9BACT|nr:ATP-binding protein [Neolewinella xylanilytica]PPK88005.1 multi-sensor signal transduction histidine kinase [Neolewinella xylanilytica]
MHVTNDPVANNIRQIYPYRVDLENCDDEPLRHIQVIQAHACLIALGKDDLIARYVSGNSQEIIGKPWQEIMDRHMREILPYEITAQISVGLGREDGFETLNPIQAFFKVGTERVLKNVIIHQNGDFLLVEVESASEFIQASRYQQLLSRAIAKIQQIREYDNLFTETAKVIRQVTAYDRVMVYRFDKDYNGEVIAEARGENLEPFEGLRYPHTDIPKQARELYLKNRVRLISNGVETPARLHSSVAVEEAPLDLTMATSRGVSPVHLEYLSHMGVNNSLSVAIVLEGKLWGLFALHHYSPRFIDYSIRSMLAFVGQIFSGHLSLQSANRYRQETLTRNLARLAIGEMITKTRNLFDGLTKGTHNIRNLFSGISGAAIHFENRYEAYDTTPPLEDIQALIRFVQEKGNPESNLVFTNEKIGEVFKPFEHYCDEAAGVLIIFMNPDFSDWICWFRPGISQTITWGGQPEKELITSEDGTRRLGPRRSFARYVETVEGCSAPWLKEEIDTAISLRITILNSLMERYTEVKQVNEQLKKALQDLETFSYTVSHDLRAPLRAINGYTEILAEDYGDQLDAEGHEIITKIHAGVQQMNSFITDILELSRVGSGGMQLESLQVSAIAAEVIAELLPVYAADTEIRIEMTENMPTVIADKRMLRQLLMNLISNALKYMQPGPDSESALQIGTRKHGRDNRPSFYISNTGPSIPKEYADTIFEMFSRLSTQSETEGTGVGLAIVERIVNRHNGKVWVSDDILGVTFNFYLAPEQL